MSAETKFACAEQEVYLSKDIVEAARGSPIVVPQHSHFRLRKGLQPTQAETPSASAPVSPAPDLRQVGIGAAGFSGRVNSSGESHPSFYFALLCL